MSALPQNIHIESVATLLDWDTELFGFRVARVVGDTITPARAWQIDIWCRQREVRCLYFLCRLDDYLSTSTAETYGYHFVDVRMTLECYLADYPLAHEPFHTTTIRPYRPEDVISLQKIARTAYHDTRFNYDAQFPPELSGLLYSTWIRVSCEGSAQQVFVAESKGQPVGYVACHLDQQNNTGSIGLVGVDQAASGNGVGRYLVLEALRWFHKSGATIVTVVTQGRNCAAQRMYQHCGFLTRSVQGWYHKWYEVAPG